MYGKLRFSLKFKSDFGSSEIPNNKIVIFIFRDHVLNKPRRPKLSTESSLLNVPRTPRKRRRKEDDHPSPNLLILLAQTDLITHASFRT